MKEIDPNGIPQHAPGAKLDQGKQRPGLVLSAFSRALQEVTKVGTYGAAKYTPNGWRSVQNAEERYYDAFWRHLLEHCNGKLLDEESGLTHISHAAWNLLAIIEFKKQNEATNTWVN